MGWRFNNFKMEDFKQYRRTQIAEMRPVTEWDIKAYQVDKEIHSMRDTEFKVSISDADRQNGSPKIGDMIARNPKNHNDQWLVAQQYFNDNFEPMRTTILKLPTKTFIGFMRCYRQLFPKVKFVDEIPQWIISSDIAAYHPYAKTIWIRNKLGWGKTILILLHELTHWFIHVFLNNNEKYHNKIDKKKMKVYVVYQENGFGGSEVAEVFSSRGIAREYVIDEIFGNNQAYRNKPENVLNNCADQFIHEYDVLFNWR